MATKTPKILILPSEDGQFYAVLRGTNGKNQWTSETQKTKSDVRRAVRRIIKNTAAAVVKDKSI